MSLSARMHSRGDGRPSTMMNQALAVKSDGGN